METTSADNSEPVTSTTYITSTHISTVTVVVKLPVAKPIVTITSQLPDPASASYPDPWMSATGANLASMNAARLASEADAANAMSESQGPDSSTETVATNNPIVNTSTADIPMSSASSVLSGSYNAGQSTGSTATVPFTNESTSSISIASDPVSTSTAAFSNTLSTQDAAPSSATTYSSSMVSSSKTSLANTVVPITLTGANAQSPTVEVRDLPEKALSRVAKIESWWKRSQDQSNNLPKPADHIREKSPESFTTHSLPHAKPEATSFEPRFRHLESPLVVWLVVTIFISLIIFRITSIMVNRRRAKPDTFDLPTWTTKPPRSGMRKRASESQGVRPSSPMFVSGNQSASRSDPAYLPHVRHSARCMESPV